MKRTNFAAPLSILSLVFLACSGTSQDHPGAVGAADSVREKPPLAFAGSVEPEAGSTCQPLSITDGHCPLPFPSNWFTVANRDSATGRTLQFPENILRPEVSNALPATHRVPVLLNGQEGFSISGPVLFEVPGKPDAASVTDGSPLAAGDAAGVAVSVFDLDTGARVPIYADASAYAAAGNKGKHVIEVFPRARFEFGHHYVAALTDNLKPADPASGPYAAPALWTDPSLAGSPAFAYHEPLVRFLEARGFERRHLLSITDFTTRTEDDATRRMYRLFRTAYGQDHPIRNVQALPSLLPDVNTIVTGDIRLTDFRGDGGDIDDTDLVGKEQWLPFMLTIPSSAKDTPAPVVLFGHPLIVDHAYVMVVASTNAKHGYATISIDIPNHGIRAFRDGGHVLMLHDPSKIGTVLGMMAQAPIDEASLLKAVRTSFANLDIAPRGLLGHTGDGKPDLDVNKVVFTGLSMGGVLGTGFLGGAGGVGLGLSGACLEVSGAGMVNILAHSKLWTGWFSGLVPSEADGAEALWYLAVAGHRIELGDGLTVAHKINYPLSLTYGLDDQVVSGRSDLALAELAHVPLLNPTLRPSDVPFLDYVGSDYPAYKTQKGAGILQLDIPATGLVPLNVETHLTFVEGRTSEVLESFLSDL